MYSVDRLSLWKAFGPFCLFVHMLGVNLNFREMIGDAIAATRNEALGKLPLYNLLSTEFRRYQARQKVHGPKSASNTVDEKEFKAAIKHIHSEITGTYNPFKWLWGLLRSILGDSQNERTVASIKNLENYAHQHDAFKFVDEAQEFLINQIEERIGDVEGLRSKYFGTAAEAVNKDPVVQALKSAILAWLEPYDKINNGEIAEIVRPSNTDIKLLKGIQDRIQYSPKSRYLEDLLPRYNEMVIGAERALYNTSSTAPTHDPTNRRRGKQLAKSLAM